MCSRIYKPPRLASSKVGELWPSLLFLLSSIFACSLSSLTRPGRLTTNRAAMPPFISPILRSFVFLSTFASRLVAASRPLITASAHLAPLRVLPRPSPGPYIALARSRSFRVGGSQPSCSRGSTSELTANRLGWPDVAPHIVVLPTPVPVSRLAMIRDLYNIVPRSLFCFCCSPYSVRGMSMPRIHTYHAMTPHWHNTTTQQADDTRSKRVITLAEPLNTRHVLRGWGFGGSTVTVAPAG